MKRNLLIILLLFLGSAGMGLFASERMQALESVEDSSIYNDNIISRLK